MSLEMPMVSAKCQYLAVSIQLQKTLSKTLVYIYQEVKMACGGDKKRHANQTIEWKNWKSLLKMWQ
jgi:hypothetical protein